jgi:hypothetical protein
VGSISDDDPAFSETRERPAFGPGLSRVLGEPGFASYASFSRLIKEI